MISRLNNKLSVFLIAAMLVLGGLVVLSYHQMPMTNNDAHSDCNMTCKITCFSQAIGSLVALPNHPDTQAFVLPIIILAFGFAIVTAIFIAFSQTFRYSLGPPLYKRLESYRI